MKCFKQLYSVGVGSPATDSVVDNSADNSTDGAINNSTGAAGDVSAQVLTGRLVDSAVIGMPYSTATQSGITGADGSYNYLANESVTFSLGGIVLPSVDAVPVVTPLDLFSTDNIGDIRVINLTRLLQTLDEDGDADNGITISESAAASATGLSVDFASANFDSQVTNLVANSGSVNTSLIDGESALDHFSETLMEEGILERPAAPDATGDENNSDNSAPAPSSNPLVGTSAEFSNFSHDIAGTLTLIDDRTFEVTGFNYDGGGPSVFFYLGTDGQYSTGAGGLLVGPRLNGRPYNNETLTVTLPDGVTLNDFNGVSVWCELFGINFGDATF